MRFDELLSRADDEVLQELVGAHTVRLLNMLDPLLARPTRLRELITSFRPPEELLRDAKTRQTLLDLLPAEAARTLAADLGLNTDKPYDSLRRFRPLKGSLGERGCSPPWG